MAQMWFGSLVPWLDPNGDPYVGALVEFFDAGTTTPQVVYTDSALGIAAGEDLREANSGGRFRALFLNQTPGSYRVRITAADGTLIDDVDGISVSQDADYVPPDTGDTSIELLARTGDVKARYGTGAQSGWVRFNGRTIGSASSGATERANADTHDLFVFLWAADTTLTVSGGRGGTAEGDFAANKTIALPDGRNRALVGLGDMGGSDVNLIPDAMIDGAETNTTLGATVGAAQITLAAGELPTHTHVAGTLKMPNHGHPVRTSSTNDDNLGLNGGFALNNNNVSTQVAYTGAPSNTIGQQIGGSGEVSITGSTGDNAGGGAHSNMPPSLLITWYIKL